MGGGASWLKDLRGQLRMGMLYAGSLTLLGMAVLP